MIFFTLLISCDNSDAVDAAEVPDCSEIEGKSWVKGDGSMSNPFQIESVEHLYYLAQKVNDTLAIIPNDFKNKYFKLVSDIDLGCKSWNPIGGQKPYSFEGYFDGNNKTITNVTINSPDKKYVGFFGAMGYYSTIENLNLKGDIIGGNYVGAIAGLSESIRITNCSFTGNITGNNYVGGLVGLKSNYGANVAYIKNCMVKGTVKGSAYLGGIAGSSSKNEIENCSVNLTSFDATDTGGGITGSSSNDKIINCSFVGDIRGKNHLGGVSGSASYTNIEFCNFNGSIVGFYRIGGIVGIASLYTKISKCHNKGVIEATGTVAGGIVGELYNSTIELSYNIGNIKAVKRCGGIVGRCSALNYSKSRIENCYNTGQLTGAFYVGGIIGGAGGSISEIYYCYNIGSVPNTNIYVGDNDYIATHDEDGYYIITVSCYYLGGDKKYSRQGISKSILEMKSETFINELNGASITSWMADKTSTINSGYPILYWQK